MMSCMIRLRRLLQLASYLSSFELYTSDARILVYHITDKSHTV